MSDFEKFVDECSKDISKAFKLIEEQEFQNRKNMMKIKQILHQVEDECNSTKDRMMANFYLNGTMEALK